MKSTRREASTLQRLTGSTTLITKLLDAPTNGVLPWNARIVLTKGAAKAGNR
jgi:hypothetical protein